MFLIQFLLCFPIISLFNQETGWVSGLYYFHHIISSLNQVLDSCNNFPSFLRCLNKALYSNARSSFTSNNTKNLGGFGRADGSRKGFTCRHMGSCGSRARPFSKNLYLRVAGMSAAAGRICGQYGREEEGSEDLPSRRCVGENGTGRGSGPSGSCGFPPSAAMTA